MRLDVKSIEYNSHNFEEENFEDFDEIYDNVMMNNIYEVEEDNIVELCNIFSTPFEEIHPHQYIKIYRMIFFVINKIGIEKGFSKLLCGLEKMDEKYIKDIVNMLVNSYDDNQIEQFKNSLCDFSNDLQIIVNKYM